MQRIDIVSHTLNHSGVSHAAITLANGLAKQNMCCRLVVVGEKTTPPYPIDKKVELHFLGVKKTQLYIIKAIVAVAKYMLVEKPENIFVWAKEFTCVVLAIRMIFRIKCKVIGVSVTSISAHLGDSKSTLLQAIHKLVYKYMFQKSDHIIAQSDGMVPELISEYNIIKQRLTVVYPPLAKKFFDTKVNKNNKSNNIIFIGKLISPKAPERLLNIFIKLLNDKPDCILRFIGDGPLLEELKSIVRSKRLENKVIFEGAQGDVIPYLKNASLLALTSRYEGFGMVLAEAIACGTPVVSFNCPVGPSDIVKDGINGYLVPVADNEMFLEKLKEALEKNWNQQEIIKTAQKFHPDIVIKGYIDVVNSVFDKE